MADKYHNDVGKKMSSSVVPNIMPETAAMPGHPKDEGISGLAGKSHVSRQTESVGSRKSGSEDIGYSGDTQGTSGYGGKSHITRPTQ